MIMPKKYFLTKGVGVNKDKLTSFEMALRDAEIACFNLVRVSSILPPFCKRVPVKEGLKYLNPGQIVHCVIAEAASNEPHRLMAASVGVAIPKIESHHGYLSEHHAFGINERDCGEYAEDLAAMMLATILGVDFDPDASYDEKKEIWNLSNEIVKTTEVTQSAKGSKEGLWTTVVAATVFVE